MVSEEKSIERNEYLVDTPSGMTIYTVEKRLAGSSPRGAVLLIHGVGIGYICWDLNIEDYSLMELLAEEGFDVFAVDLRGYGKSTRPDGLTVNSETCADDLKAVIDFIGNLRHLERVDIVGHSFGGMVAVYLAGKYPECIERVVLIGYPYKVLHPDFQPVVDEMVKLANAGVPYFSNELVFEEYLYSYEQEVVDIHRKLRDQLYPEWPMGIFLDIATLKNSDYIPAITAPTLLINGALEEVVDADDAMRCLNDLGAKEKAILVVGNAYHCVWLEKIAHRSIYEAVLGWLRS